MTLSFLPIHSGDECHRSFTDPYPGAEPPEVLHPYWLYLQRPL